MPFAKKKKDQPADLFLEWLVRWRWPESQGSASEQVGVIVAIDLPTTKPKRLARGILSFAKIALLHCFPLYSFETQKLETPGPTIRSRWFHLPVFLTGVVTLLGALMY